LLSLLALLPLSATADKPLDHIVAVVEDDVVLRSELDHELKGERARLRAAGKAMPPNDVLERRVLEEIILSRLQATAAARSGVTVSETEVDEAVEGIARRNNITVAQMKQILGRSGMSYDGFRDNIRKQLLEVNFQRQQVLPKIQITDAEIDKYLAEKGKSAPAGKVVTQTHARHILIRTGERTSDQEARSRLETLRSRIANGEAFESLARANSDDTASALKGGDIGWINPGDTAPEFERQMDTLQLNEVSQPFHTPFGWHLVQVLERRQQNIADEAQRDEARSKLRERKAKEALELLARRLRADAFVDIRLGKEDLEDIR
jgi:peptidyl-prolyl cis-trans isomerase SurA